MIAPPKTNEFEPDVAELPQQPLPHGWEWGFLARGLRSRKQFVSIDDGKRYKRVTVQLHGRGIVLRDEVLGSQVTTKQQQLLRSEDFLVAEIDAKVGGFGVVPQGLEGAIVSSHYFTFEFDKTQLLPGYLAALVRVGSVTREVQRFVRGSLNYAAIRPKHVLAVRIAYPPLRAQEEIIGRLAAVDRARLQLLEQVAAIDALPAALLREAFVGGA